MEDLYKHTNDDHNDVCARDYAATDTPIQTYGTQLPKVSFGYRRVFAVDSLAYTQSLTSQQQPTFLFEGNPAAVISVMQPNERATKPFSTFAHHPYNGYHFFHVTDKIVSFSRV